jgi:RHS repeat-associated protein
VGRLTTAGTLAPEWLNPAYFNGGLACTNGPSVVTARFKYDARNRRIARWLAATNQWTHIVSDPSGNPLSELVQTGDPANPWARLRDYVWLDGKPLAQIEYPGPAGSSQGYVYYFHLDHLGLPRALTNQSGQVVWSSAPRPYGDLVETTAVDPLSGRTVVTNLRLPGQYDERLLGSVGLQGPYYNWHRWYLPGVGRYLELDPIALGGGLNGRGSPDWYNYALGNPMRYTDPSGEAAAAIPILWGAAALVAAWETYVVQCTAAGTCPWSPKKCEPVPWNPPRVEPFPIPAPPIEAGKGCSCVCYQGGKGPNAIGWRPSAFQCQEDCNKAGYSGYKCGGGVTWPPN